MTLSVCCHSKILLLWQRYETTSPLYFNQERFFLGGGGGGQESGGWDKAIWRIVRTSEKILATPL